MASWWSAEYMLISAVFLCVTYTKDQIKWRNHIHVRVAEDLVRLGFGDDASSVASFEAFTARTIPTFALFSALGDSGATSQSRFYPTPAATNERQIADISGKCALIESTCGCV